VGRSSAQESNSAREVCSGEPGGRATRQFVGIHRQLRFCPKDHLPWTGRVPEK
jgi:hypothetical protein